MRNLIVILLGPPGAGKGTQAELLAKKLDLYYFETSDVIEQAVNSAGKGEFVKIKGKKYLFSRQKNLWKKGLLCNPIFVSYLVKKKIKSIYKKDKNIIFAGSPRSVEEAEEIMPILEKLYGKKNIKIILLRVSAKESIFRNSHRRICSLFRHPILYNKETRNLTICPLDGSKLMRRKKLDDPKTIKVRLEEYKRRTFPLISYLQAKKYKVRKISGEGSVSQVFKRLGTG